MLIQSFGELLLSNLWYMGSFTIKNKYYKYYYMTYYLEHRDYIIDYNLQRYYDNRAKIREKQNYYYKHIYYPKRHMMQHKPRPKMLLNPLKIEKNVTVSFD